MLIDRLSIVLIIISILNTERTHVWWMFFLLRLGVPKVNRATSRMGVTVLETMSPCWVYLVKSCSTSFEFFLVQIKWQGHVLVKKRKHITAVLLSMIMIATMMCIMVLHTYKIIINIISGIFNQMKLTFIWLRHAIYNFPVYLSCNDARRT